MTGTNTDYRHQRITNPQQNQTEAKPKREEHVTANKTYSFGRLMNVTLKNKKATLSVAKFCMYTGTGALQEGIGMEHKGKVTKAKGASKGFVAFHLYAESQLGKTVVSCKNVGQIQELKNSEDLKEAVNLFKAEGEKDPSLYGRYGLKPGATDEEISSHLRPSTTLSDGVCKGTCIHLIGEISSGNDLVNTVSSFGKGVPTKAAALHCLYQTDQKIKIGPKNIGVVLDNYKLVKKGMSDEDKNLINALIGKTFSDLEDASRILKMDFTKLDPEIYQEVDAILKRLGDESSSIDQSKFSSLGEEAAKLLNGLFDDAHSAEQTKVAAKIAGLVINEREGLTTLGHAAQYASSEEHLANLHDLKPGNYQASFDTGKGGHATAVFIREHPEPCSIFDPNIGLIQCDKSELGEAYLKLITTCYAPPSGEDTLTKDPEKPNYNVSFYEYSSPDQPKTNDAPKENEVIIQKGLAQAQHNLRMGN